MGTRAVSAPLWCPLSKQGVLSLSMLQGVFEGRSEGPQGFVAAAGFRSWRLESRGSEMLGGEGPLLSKGQGGYQAICEWSRGLQGLLAHVLQVEGGNRQQPAVQPLGAAPRRHRPRRPPWQCTPCLSAPDARALMRTSLLHLRFCAYASTDASAGGVLKLRCPHRTPLAVYSTVKPCKR